MDSARGLLRLVRDLVANDRKLVPRILKHQRKYYHAEPLCFPHLDDSLLSDHHSGGMRSHAPGSNVNGALVISVGALSNPPPDPSEIYQTRTHSRSVSVENRFLQERVSGVQNG